MEQSTEHLLLLHGALGGKQQLEPLCERLQKRLAGQLTVHTLNFEGHGGRLGSRRFSIELFVENVLTYMADNGIGHCAIFGYSMGGYVALKLAAAYPGKIRSIITLGTKFAWSPEIAARETAMLDPAKIEEKIPHYVETLKELHAPLDWKAVMHNTADMMRDLGDRPSLLEADLKQVNIPVALLLGSEDVMVTKEETVKVGELIPHAYVEIVEGWQHPIERIDPDQLAAYIGKYLE